MPTLLDPREILVHHGCVAAERLDAQLESLNGLAEATERLIASPLACPASSIVLSRFVLVGPKSGGDVIKIGIFAGIHGDEPGGVHAAMEFVKLLVGDPGLATGYQVFVYPVCNPHGCALGSRFSSTGKDLNREFWRESTEPEVQLLEREIREQRFDGLVSLHADDTSHGVYGFVRGAVLTRALLDPALKAAEAFLPRNNDSLIDGFPAENGIISECYDGILTSPPDLKPLPFEIILETPHGAPLDLQAEALVAALRAVFVEYPKFLAFAANL